MNTDFTICGTKATVGCSGSMREALESGNYGHYRTFIPPNWDGEQVLFAACVTTQTVQTHANLGIHIVSTGKR
jgi:hypothetical protein